MLEKIGLEIAKKIFSLYLQRLIVIKKIEQRTK